MFKVADAHAHLADLDDLEEAIQRAAEAGVCAIASMGVDLQSNMATMRIAEQRCIPALKLYPCLGLHPWGIIEEDVESTLAYMRKHVEKAAGVGEVGLDYWLKEVKKNPSGKRLQRFAFEETLQMAKEFDKPITIHGRGAWEECFDLAVSVGVKKAVFHWYTGSIELLKRIIDEGYYVSATPALAYSKDHRTAILEASLENLLIETDAPVKYGLKASEPKDVLITLTEVSKLKGVETRQVAEKTFTNFLKLYQTTR